MKHSILVNFITKDIKKSSRPTGVGPGYKVQKGGYINILMADSHKIYL